MLKRLVLAFLILAVVVGFAGTVPGVGGTYKITLLQPSTLKGTDLKAGEYRLSLLNDKVTLVNGKTSVEVQVNVETAQQKFDGTAIRYTEQGGKAQIAEIRIGGTKTKLIFNN
jgi:hypothetical protein